MFMCRFTQEQFEDKDLAYTAIIAARLAHPAKETFVLKFSSKKALLGFFDQIKNQQQEYVVTKVHGNKTYGPDSPLDLIHLVGGAQ
ncbi:MAG TPA: hypothetical protein VK191_09915 [Symbiobacteriaceae bacterium]|nr:hypothetical protein [Symbiobacteriaceae bacterium]